MEGFSHIRDQFGTKRTTGILHYNGQPLTFPFEGAQKNVFICEDVARAYGVKIDKETAIGDGECFITITFSNRFQRLMPILFNVKDLSGELIIQNDKVVFRGVRQHIGNTELNTDACQLTGFTRNENGVFTSSKCFEQYFPWLEQELKKWPNNTAPYRIINQQS